jgi:hypothetical protein
MKPSQKIRFDFNLNKASISLDLAKNKTWAFHWGPRDNWQSRAGVYEYFPPNSIKVLIIARDNQCAVYLDNTPLDYFENCRADINAKPSPRSATFHILAEAGHFAVMTIDNVKLWDLDKIPQLSSSR